MAVPHRLGDSAAPDLTGPTRALPWADRALCAETDPELFFSDVATTYVTVDGAREMTAKAICRRCPVKPECLEYAMGDPHLQGIWGGMSDRDRGTLRQSGRSA